jgi:hypothetical protein
MRTSLRNRRKLRGVRADEKPGLKKCNVCHQLLPTGDFEPWPWGRKHVMSTCKKCVQRRENQQGAVIRNRDIKSISVGPTPPENPKEGDSWVPTVSDTTK